MKMTLRREAIKNRMQTRSISSVSNALTTSSIMNKQRIGIMMSRKMKI